MDKKLKNLGLICLVLLMLACSFVSDAATQEPVVFPTDTEVIVEPTEIVLEEPTAEVVEQPTQSVVNPGYTIPSYPDAWKEFAGNEVSIWLPDTWLDMSNNVDIEELLDMTSETMPEMEAQIELVKQNPDLYKLFVFDLNGQNPAYMNNLNIITQEIPLDMEIEDYAQLAASQFPENFIPVNGHLYQTDSFDFWTWDIFTDIYGIEVHVKQFLALKDNLAVTLTFSMDFESGALYGELIETAVDTFILIPVE